MKPIFSTLMAASLALFTHQTAEACGSYKSMSPSDYAFADVIFEGEVKQIFPKFRYNKYSKRDQIVSAKILFDIDEVLRGELPHSEVLVGYELHTFGAPKSVEEFVEQYGRNVRVGLVTPEQHDWHCREQTVEYTSGTGVKSEKQRIGCDFSYFHLEKATEIPFIHTASCANQFIFDTSKPIVMPDFGIENHNSKLVGIFREYSDWFTPKLTEDSSLMDRLLEEGLKLYQIDRRTAGQTDEEREATIEWAHARLRKEFLVLANLSQIDPRLRERFLRESLADIER